jgi:hypothetical protein
MLLAPLVMVVSATLVAFPSPMVVKTMARVTMASEEAKPLVLEAVRTTSAAEEVVIGTLMALVVTMEAETRLGMLLRRRAEVGKLLDTCYLLPWQWRMA